MQLRTTSIPKCAICPLHSWSWQNLPPLLLNQWPTMLNKVPLQMSSSRDLWTKPDEIEVWVTTYGYCGRLLCHGDNSKIITKDTYCTHQKVAKNPTNIAIKSQIDWQKILLFWQLVKIGCLIIPVLLFSIVQGRHANKLGKESSVQGQFFL